MLRLSVAVAVILAAAPVFASGSHAVRGHITTSGVYVAPTRATNPNSVRFDNYSARPNINPASGKVGTVDPFKPKPFKPYRTR
jgi:hypothetical protein